MIRVMPKSDNTVAVTIELQLPHESIFSFLQSKGYQVKVWKWKFQDETFPGGITNYENWTFTATKEGEDQNEETMFLKVFEKEIKQILKELQNK